MLRELWLVLISVALMLLMVNSVKQLEVSEQTLDACLNATGESGDEST